MPDKSTAEALAFVTGLQAHAEDAERAQLYRPVFERSLAVQAAADAAALHMRLHPEPRQAELIPVGETSDWGPLDDLTPMKLETECTPDPMLDLQAQTNALLQAVLDELRALRQDARHSGLAVL